MFLFSTCFLFFLLLFAAAAELLLLFYVKKVNNNKSYGGWWRPPHQTTTTTSTKPTDRQTDEGNQYLVFSSFTWEPLLGEEVFMCEKFFRWFFCSFWRFFLWCCRSFFFLFSYLWIFTWIGMGFKLIFFLKASERYDDTFSKKKKK